MRRRILPNKRRPERKMGYEHRTLGVDWERRSRSMLTIGLRYRRSYRSGYLEKLFQIGFYRCAHFRWERNGYPNPVRFAFDGCACLNSHWNAT